MNSFWLVILVCLCCYIEPLATLLSAALLITQPPASAVLLAETAVIIYRAQREFMSSQSAGRRTCVACDWLLHNIHLHS